MMSVRELNPTKNGKYDTIRLFFDRERAENFAREVGGYIASEMGDDKTTMFEVRFLKRRAR